MSDILQSVDNALGVLDLLSKYDELGVAEVARYMGVAKSTAFRLLATLEKTLTSTKAGTPDTGWG